MSVILRRGRKAAFLGDLCKAKRCFPCVADARHVRPRTRAQRTVAVSPEDCRHEGCTQARGFDDPGLTAGSNDRVEPKQPS